MISPHISERFLRHLASNCLRLHGEKKDAVFVWSGKTLARLATATTDDAYRACAQARHAYRHWSRIPYRQKARIFLRWSELINRHQEKLIQLAQIFSGKSRQDAVDEFLDAYITPQEVAAKLNGIYAPRPALSILPIQSRLGLTYEPYGVTGIFTLNDFPISYGPVDVIQPLAAGNAVVQFVPIQAALCAYATRELLESAGMPKGVWQIVPAVDVRVGLSVLGECDVVSFIGNTATGVDILNRANDMLIPTVTFLSVKNQGVVFNDVDVNKVVPKVVRAVFHMAGQGPCHIERVWVQRGIYQKFLERFEDYVRYQVRIGQSWDNSTTLGSLYSQDRLMRVKSHVEDALQMGATLVHGGQVRKDIGPWFFEPTILINLPKDALCYDEETYGPVVSIESFDDFDELTSEMSRTQYGYHLLICSHDKERIRKLSCSTSAGLISVNDAYHGIWGSQSVPLSGSRDTGDGIRHGKESITQYMRSHACLHLRWGSIDPDWEHTGDNYEKRLLLKAHTLVRFHRFLHMHQM